MPLPEKISDACPLDESQRRRILDRVLAGPVTELLAEVARRLPNGSRRRGDDTDCQRTIDRRLQPMQIDIAMRDETGRAGFSWPGTGLTHDDRRRLATMGNTTRLSTTRLLHHSVQVAHHLFQAILLEIMATSERTGVAVRDLLTNKTDGNGHPVSNAASLPREDAPSQPDVGHPSLETPEAPVSGTSGDGVEASADDRSSLAADAADEFCTNLSIPPQPMAKRTQTTPTRESVTEDRVEELEDRIDRLQETMQVLIDAIDGLRDDLVHTLRNLPDRLPPPLHIHSLPLDPTDPECGERVNAIPQDVMDRLRHDAGRGGGGESVGAAAAEGNPSPAAVIDDRPPREHRQARRQPRLFV